MAGKKVIIVGEIYDADLTIGGGPMPPGQPPTWGGGGQPGPFPPPGVWGGAGQPSFPGVMPPIAYPPPGWGGGGQPGPFPPPGTWGGAGQPSFPVAMPPIFIPPGVIDGVHPEHPIVIPPPSSPGAPAHPIVIPPDSPIWPPDAHPEHPIVIPPTPPGTPTHPIVLPPNEPPKVLSNWDVKTYWTAQSGWAVAIVPSDSHPGVPTPAQ